MAQNEEVKDVGADPEYITYLLNIAVHKTYFFVGKEKTKIGAVKLMLAAHSDVLRSELLDSPLAEKENVYLDDISPRTFKNLLRYVYGFNQISNLSFDEADDLLYAADKYLIKNLKAQLALRLMDLLDCQNICSLLNNPACHTVLELDAKITEILQFETDAVFKCPDFMNLRVEGFIKILEQDALVVSEMEVWKTALKWAKNQGCSVDSHPKCSTSSLSQKSTEVSPRESQCLSLTTEQEVEESIKSAHSSTLLKEDCLEDGSILQKYISLLKHIRIRTFNHEEICKEVIPTKVLTNDDMFEICISHGKGEPVPIIKGFSQKTDQRQLIIEEFFVPEKRNNHFKQSCFTIIPTSDIALLQFEFMANESQSSLTHYQCECTIDIMPNNIPDQKKIVKFNQKVHCGQIFKVTLPAKCRRLTSNNSYTITITFNVPHSADDTDEQSVTCKNFHIQSNTSNSGRYVYHFWMLMYAKLSSK